MAHWHNLGVLTMAGIITLSPWVPTYRTTKGKYRTKGEVCKAVSSTEYFRAK